MLSNNVATGNVWLNLSQLESNGIKISIPELHYPCSDTQWSLWLPSILDGTDIRTFPSPWKAQMGSSATKVRDLPYLQSFSQAGKIVVNWVLSFSQAHLTHLTPPSHSGFMCMGVPSLPFSTHQPWWGCLSVLLFVRRVSLTIPFYQDCIVIVCLSLFLTDSKPGFLALSRV